CRAEYRRPGGQPVAASAFPQSLSRASGLSRQQSASRLTPGGVEPIIGRIDRLGGVVLGPFVVTGGGSMLDRLRLFGATAGLLCIALPAWSQELPEGKGKELVAAHCNSCHPFQARVGAGYTPKGWTTVIRMMTNFGVSLSADQAAAITEYLAKNFPEKGKPAGVVMPGPVKISIKEWQAGPPPHGPPHPPAPTAA